MIATVESIFKTAAKRVSTFIKSFMTKVDALSGTSSVDIIQRGHNFVAAWGDFVIKMPDESTVLFDREVRAVQCAQFAATMGFVDARVINVPKELSRALPRKLRAIEQAIAMPLLPGLTAIDANLSVVDPDIIASSVIDSHCKLVTRGWYNTDCKLENIQLTGHEVKLLDWGSLCPGNATDPTYTYCINGYHRFPHVCMSVNLVVTLLQLYGRPAPEHSIIESAEYNRMYKLLKEFIREPLLTRVKNILLQPQDD